MEAMEAILTRRSIRSYADKAIGDEEIEGILRAAMAAPSAGNQQPWEFVVIDDRGMLDRIPEVHPYAQMAAQAPMAIVVCGDLKKEKHKGLWVQDCAAATENLLLAAHASGLGAVWCGVHPNAEREGAVRAFLKLPEGVIPLALLVLGYPGEEKPPSDRYDPVRVHRNGWGA
jgi:nitroreductase